jgi:hypothetical protein
VSRPARGAALVVLLAAGFLVLALLNSDDPLLLVGVGVVVLVAIPMLILIAGFDRLVRLARDLLRDDRRI